MRQVRYGPMDEQVSTGGPCVQDSQVWVILTADRGGPLSFSEEPEASILE